MENRYFGDGSLIELIKRDHPDLLTLVLPTLGKPEKELEVFKSGTTIIAAKYKDGVIMAADRRSSSGYRIADERIQKIHDVDRYSVIGSAGTAKICQELAQIMKAELEFYEKIMGREMTFEAKINRCGYLTSLNMRGMSAGLYAVPILAGFDKERGIGRIFQFDVIGSPTEAEAYASQGSGTVSTVGSLPMLYKDKPGEVSRDELIRRILAVLKQVVRTDMGSGFDPSRGIWPSIKVMSKTGCQDVPDEELKPIWDNLD